MVDGLVWLARSPGLAPRHNAGAHLGRLPMRAPLVAGGEARRVASMTPKEAWEWLTEYRYFGHRTTCAVYDSQWEGGDAKPCDCGFDEASPVLERAIQESVDG